MVALKGAFLSFGAGLMGALPNIVVFQFNPVQVTRSPAVAERAPSHTDTGAINVRQQTSPPAETIDFTLKVDANDQLAAGSKIAAASGILPMLSALELLMLPKSQIAINLVKLVKGKGKPGPHQSPSKKVPTVLFFWGAYRILPVMINHMTITETEYDPLLNPVRADVAVTLQVLVPDQMKGEKLGKAAFYYTQGVKELMATLQEANAGFTAGKSIVKFL